MVIIQSNKMVSIFNTNEAQILLTYAYNERKWFISLASFELSLEHMK